MSKEKLGQEIAFPNSNGNNSISKRFYAACVAIQGLTSRKDRDNFSIEDDVELAYKFADELLRQENE